MLGGPGSESRSHPVSRREVTSVGTERAKKQDEVKQPRIGLPFRVGALPRNGSTGLAAGTEDHFFVANSASMSLSVILSAPLLTSMTGGAARRHPHRRVAETGRRPSSAGCFSSMQEVRVALRLHRDDFVSALNASSIQRRRTPDSSAVSLARLAVRLELVPGCESVRALRQVDAEPAGLVAGLAALESGRCVVPRPLRLGNLSSHASRSRVAWHGHHFEIPSLFLSRPIHSRLLFIRASRATAELDPPAFIRSAEQRSPEQCRWPCPLEPVRRSRPSRDWPPACPARSHRQ